MASPAVVEDRPAPLDATAEPPALFDGTTRLYISYTCPFAQRVWITRNVKGLQDKIKLVAIDLGNRPVWYKEKVYPENKVPALEHDGKVMGESLDLIKYLDINFEGPSLYPEDRAKREFGEELLKYTDTLNKTVYGSFKGDPAKETATVFDYLENSLHKFDEGPFFLGQLSLVDIAYIPFIERFKVFLDEVFKYDITAGRPTLETWIQEMNKKDAYTQTKMSSNVIVEIFKKRFM
ncbi:PREDICTED: glutathione S-transferase L3-like [Tarenaya hassleriana]|uniref:glutathione S-transferase L3-like n=1 Tax=Tarenaya hassleriana TaxID=28532 RepID=UPI00053C345C|nr:PREDICTED: glutathione S-transferase L3-like [Tarenaya hassleriana]